MVSRALLLLVAALLTSHVAQAVGSDVSVAARGITNSTESLLRETEELLQSQDLNEVEEKGGGEAQAANKGGEAGGSESSQGGQAPQSSSHPQAAPNPVFDGLNGEAKSMPDPITGEGAGAAPPGAGAGGNGGMPAGISPHGAPGSFPSGYAAPQAFPELEDFASPSEMQRFKRQGVELDQSMLARDGGADAGGGGGGGGAGGMDGFGGGWGGRPGGAPSAYHSKRGMPPGFGGFGGGEDGLPSQFAMVGSMAQAGGDPGMQGMQGMPQGMQGMPQGMQGMPQGMQGMPQGMQGMPQGMPGMPGMPGLPQGMSQGLPPGMRGPGFGSRFASRGMGGGMGGMMNMGGLGMGGMGVQPPPGMMGGGGGGGGSSGRPVVGGFRDEGIPPPMSLLDEGDRVGGLGKRSQQNPLDGLYGHVSEPDQGEMPSDGMPDEGAANGWSRTLPYDGGVPGGDTGRNMMAAAANAGLGVPMSGDAADAAGAGSDADADAVDADAGGAPDGNGEGGAPGAGWSRKGEVSKELQWERAHSQQIAAEDAQLEHAVEDGAGRFGMGLPMDVARALGRMPPAPGQGRGMPPGPGQDRGMPPGLGQGQDEGQRPMGGQSMTFEQAEQLAAQEFKQQREGGMPSPPAQGAGGSEELGRGGRRGGRASPKGHHGAGAGAGAGRSQLRFRSLPGGGVAFGSESPSFGSQEDAQEADRLDRPLRPLDDGAGTGRPLSVFDMQQDTMEAQTEAQMGGADAEGGAEGEEETPTAVGSDVEDWMEAHPLKEGELLPDDGSWDGDPRVHNTIGTGEAGGWDNAARHAKLEALEHNTVPGQGESGSGARFQGLGARLDAQTQRMAARRARRALDSPRLRAGKTEAAPSAAAAAGGASVGDAFAAGGLSASDAFREVDAAAFADAMRSMAAQYSSPGLHGGGQGAGHETAAAASRMRDTAAAGQRAPGAEGGGAGTQLGSPAFRLGVDSASSAGQMVQEDEAGKAALPITTANWVPQATEGWRGEREDDARTLSQMVPRD